jgi:hypothetical protein
MEETNAEVEEEDDFLEDPAVEIQRKYKPQLQLYARSITKPVIDCFKHKIVQVRFNPYMRAPLRTLRVVEFDEDNARTNVEKTVRSPSNPVREHSFRSTSMKLMNASLSL